MINKTSNEKEWIFYNQIRIKREKFSLFPRMFPLDFKPEKSNKIIKGLVKRIGRYEELRGIETEYHKAILNNGKERIRLVNIKSKDKIIEGKIEYNSAYKDPRDALNLDSYCGYINLEFRFNSKDPRDKQEYLGLIKIIREIK